MLRQKCKCGSRRRMAHIAGQQLGSSPAQCCCNPAKKGHNTHVAGGAALCCILAPVLHCCRNGAPLEVHVLTSWRMSWLRHKVRSVHHKQHMCCRHQGRILHHCTPETHVSFINSTAVEFRQGAGLMLMHPLTTVCTLPSSLRCCNSPEAAQFGTSKAVKEQLGFLPAT